jgi:hypothetical protein
VPSPAAPRILSFYRAVHWGRMRRVLLLGPSVLASGGLVVAVSFLTRQPPGVRTAAAAAGLVLVAGGALYTLAGMHRILRDDVVLALRTDGLALTLQDPARELFIEWDALEAARWDASSAQLILQRRGASDVVLARPFAGISGKDLAQRIAVTKRRLAMNLPP